MTVSRNFRFGTAIQASSRFDLIDQIRRVEQLGYDAVTVNDHVSMPRWGPISMLAAVAALSSSLSLSSTVFGNDFRHPALLANEAATIDLISDGRLELGIGTGWWEPDYAQAGIPFEAPGTRVSRLIEAIHVMKGLFSDEPCTFSGKHYTIRNLNGMPKPIQRPHPRILIGGGGKRMLSLAAREANIVSINPTTKDGTMDFQTYSPDAFDQKVEWIRQAAGTRFDELELHSMLFGVIITDDQQQAADSWIRQVESMVNAPIGLSVEDVLASPYILMGTVDQMVAKLEFCRDKYGVSYFTTASMISMDILGPVIAQIKGK
ncbi:MAG: TIGR03621 family F420-dependent LLM class oxidoreductase [Caldilineaceae bacterium]